MQCSCRGNAGRCDRGLRSYIHGLLLHCRVISVILLGQLIAPHVRKEPIRMRQGRRHVTLVMLAWKQGTISVLIESYHGLNTCNKKANNIENGCLKPKLGSLDVDVFL